MSRTNKTRPWWVKAAERPQHVHDHRDGICNFQNGTAANARDYHRNRGKCYSTADWSRPEFRCGCYACTGWEDDARHTRREGKRLARDWWRENA